MVADTTRIKIKYVELVCIKIGKSTLDYFGISNCVRQGGMLSPKLFALYLNSLTNKIVDCKAGY